MQHSLAAHVALLHEMESKLLRKTLLPPPQLDWEKLTHFDAATHTHTHKKKAKRETKAEKLNKTIDNSHKGKIKQKKSIYESKREMTGKKT